MPVTFKVAAHDAKSISIEKNPPKTAEDFLQASCYVYNQLQRRSNEAVLQSSVTESALPTLRAQKNGFVHTIIEAYGQHHHLKIRPDDVWIAILSQLSFYINKHAEELRTYFVAHEGKEELHVTGSARGIRSTLDAWPFRCQIKFTRTYVVDKTLVEWVLPDFTTSTTQDVTICSVLLMSTLQKYFGFTMSLICGIPSVTLEGEKADWEKLYKRLDRLPELGAEPEQWAAMLRPILRRFVDAFDGNPDIAFWEHVVYRNNRLCGRDRISGWITAFCVWDGDGNWLASDPKAGMAESVPGSVMSPMPAQSYSDPDYALDGVPYFALDMKDIPAGYSEVDVLVNDNGEEFDCKMVSGHVASAASKAVEDGAFDTLSPAPQWFLYVKANQQRRGYGGGD